MMTNQIARFETIIVPAKETAKAYCVLGGQWLPKSQVKIVRQIAKKEVERFRGQPKRGIIQCLHVEIEAPKWLFR